MDYNFKALLDLAKSAFWAMADAFSKLLAIVTLAAAVASMVISCDALAGLPPTTIKGSRQTSPTTTFNYQVPNFQATNLGGVTSRIETGNANLLINPSFENPTVASGWTQNQISSIALNGNFVDGAKGVSVTTNNTTATFLSQSISLTNVEASGLSRVQMQSSVWARKNSGIDLYWCVSVDSVEQGCQLLQSGTLMLKYTNFFSFAATGSTVVINSYFKSTSSAAYNFDADFAYMGLATDLQSATISTPMTDYGPLTITGGTKASSPATDKFYGSRIGPYLFYSIQYRQTSSSGAANGSGIYRFQIPPATGCTINTTVSPAYTGTDMLALRTTIGSGIVAISGIGGGFGSPYVYDSNNIAIAAASNLVGNILPIGGDTNGGANWYGLGNATVDYTVSGVVSCVGWDAGTSFAVTNPTPFYPSFSAQISSAGAVSSETSDFINGSCSVANTSEFTCSFNSSFWSTAPNCTATGLETGSAAPIVKILTQATTSSVVVKTYNNSASATAYAFNLNCQATSVSYGPSVQAINSVVTGSPGVSNIFFGRVAGASDTTGCTGTCTLYDSGGNTSLATPTRSSTGLYSINVNPGVCSTKLSCTITGGDPSNSQTCGRNVSATATTTSYGVYCVQSGVGVVDVVFNFSCACAK